MEPLIRELTGALRIGVDQLWPLALVFLRTGAMLAMLPAFGETVLPQRIRLAAAVLMTLLVTPVIQPSPGTGQSGHMAALATEVIAGLLLGFLLRLLIMALQIAGSIISQSVSLAQMFSGTGPEPQPIVANLLTLAAITLFCAQGGLVRAVELLVHSYELLPAGKIPAAATVAELGLARITRVFALSFSLAAPFVIAALLYNLTLGAINRAMPGLMVTFIGAPALTLGGLILLAMASPLLLQVWQHRMQMALSDPFGTW